MTHKAQANKRHSKGTQPPLIIANLSLSLPASVFSGREASLACR